MDTIIENAKPFYGTGHPALYAKFVYTPDDWGIGITLYLDEPGFELAFHLLCWQVWIGR